MKARAHVLISGQVQGVFFRYETRDLAENLGAKGWVKNTPDGKVEAVFEGDKKKVNEMLDFCRRGPPGARVTGVKVNWENPKSEFSGFRIKYGW